MSSIFAGGLGNITIPGFDQWMNEQPWYVVIPLGLVALALIVVVSMVARSVWEKYTKK
jgi:hypothetical protein